MSKYIFKVTALLSFFFIISCEDADELLNQHIKNGPIVYAAKIKEMNTQSGYYRFRANIYPGEDVNKSYCILKWSITEAVKDSVRVDYIPSNFDNNLKCYYALIDFPPTDNFEGSLEIKAYSVDAFGNKSLNEIASAYIYGVNYVSSLVNAQVRISPQIDKISFESRIGAVGSYLSYEQNDGNFSEEVFVTESSHPLINAKPGGIARTKTRYKVNGADLDMLDVTEYLETKIP